MGNRLTKTNEVPPTANETTNYTYDDENRLTKVVITKNAKQKELTFTYDPFGRRITKTLTKDEIGTECTAPNACPRTTTYVYDNQSIIAEYDTNGEVQNRYTHGPNIDEPLSIEVKTGATYTPYYYHADGLGSITSISNNQGTIVQRYAYDSFGNITITTNGNINQPYTYTSREYDTETGMYFYRARYYDPKAGRFVTKDPIGFGGGDVNLYGYTKNNSVNYTDPLGLCICDGGTWDIGTGDVAFTFSAGIYLSTAWVTYTCRSNPKTICKGKKFCVGGGKHVSISGGFSAGGTVFGYTSSDSLSGWSPTYLTGGIAYGIGRIGISAPFIDKGGSVTGGLGFGGGIALITCVVFDLKCECPCK